ncbi:MAG: tetratricopeptide repeat protein, partial [Chloroflexi bacterium]|nr:tetratricopeptide repeat protein [Chloroflexota bacterium]
ARKLYQEALAIGRELGAPWSIAICLDRLGLAEYGLGQFEEARRLLGESMAIYQATQDRYGIARVQCGLGSVAFALGEYQEARRLHAEALARFQEIGDKPAMVSAQNALGFDLCALQDYAAADEIFREALTQSLKMDTKPSALESLVGLVTICYALAPAKGAPSQEDAIKSLEVLIFSQRHPACSQETRSRINLLLAQFFPTISAAEASAIYNRVAHRQVEELAAEL